MIDIDTKSRRQGLPQWYTEAESRTRTGIRNPGSRAIADDCRGFQERLPLESAFRSDPEYRRLRGALDRLTTRLVGLELSRAPAFRLRAAQTKVNAAGAAVASYLLRHMPEEAPPAPVVLTRELDADGALVSESETEVGR